MIGITALERGEDYRQTQHDVEIHVRRINEIYGNGGLVVHCEERSEKDFRLVYIYLHVYIYIHFYMYIYIFICT
jgi:trehalose-6-phosphate synthase